MPTIRLSIVQAVRTEKAAKNADQEYIQDVAISLNKTAGEQQASSRHHDTPKRALIHKEGTQWDALATPRSSELACIRLQLWRHICNLL